MIYPLLIWLAFIAIEITCDYLQIKHKITIDHIHGYKLRFMAGILLWLVSGVFGIQFGNWIVIPFMEMFTFWLLFDAGLNLARGKSIAYLGEGSKLDRFQAKTFGGSIWLFFKFLLAAASITVYFLGYEAILRYE